MPHMQIIEANHVDQEHYRLGTGSEPAPYDVVIEQYDAIPTNESVDLDAEVPEGSDPTYLLVLCDDEDGDPLAEKAISAEVATAALGGPDVLAKCREEAKAELAVEREDGTAWASAVLAQHPERPRA